MKYYHFPERLINLPKITQGARNRASNRTRKALWFQNNTIWSESKYVRQGYEEKVLEQKMIKVMYNWWWGKSEPALWTLPTPVSWYWYRTILVQDASIGGGWVKVRGPFLYISLQLLMNLYFINKFFKLVYGWAGSLLGSLLPCSGFL